MHRRPSLFASSTHKTFVTQLGKVGETGTTKPLFATAPQYSDTLLELHPRTAISKEVAPGVALLGLRQIQVDQ